MRACCRAIYTVTTPIVPARITCEILAIKATSLRDILELLSSVADLYASVTHRAQLPKLELESMERLIFRSMSELPDEYCTPRKEDLERLVQYLSTALSDPVRISVLLAHGLIEDMIDDFIKELVPNHEFLNLPKARFSDKLR